MDQFFTPFREYPVAFVAELTTLLPLVIGLFYLRSLQQDLKLLLFLFFIFFVRDISSNFLASLKENNLFVYNLSSVLEIFFLAFIFYCNTSIKSKIYRRIIIYGGIICLLTSVLLYTRDDFSAGDFTIVRIYGMTLTAAFFERILSEVAVKDILKYPMFWVGSGFLLYFCGTFFIFLLSNEVLSKYAERDVFKLYWDTSLLFYMVFCLLSSIGIHASQYDNNLS
jgi:hypothetical protein